MKAYKLTAVVRGTEIIHSFGNVKPLELNRKNLKGMLDVSFEAGDVQIIHSNVQRLSALQALLEEFEEAFIDGETAVITDVTEFRRIMNDPWGSRLDEAKKDHQGRLVIAYAASLGLADATCCWMNFEAGTHEVGVGESMRPYQILYTGPSHTLALKAFVGWIASCGVPVKQPGKKAHCTVPIEPTRTDKSSSHTILESDGVVVVKMTKDMDMGMLHNLIAGAVGEATNHKYLIDATISVSDTIAAENLEAARLQFYQKVHDAFDVAGIASYSAGICEEVR